MCHWGWSVSSDFHSVHTQTFPRKLLGNVSDTMDHCLKGSSTQMNSFAFHELQVRSFFTALPPSHTQTHTHITQICLPSCHISFWCSLTECYSRTQMAHSTHTIALKMFCFLSWFALMWHQAARRWIMFIGCQLVCWQCHAWLPGVIYCMWQYVQAISLSIVPCFLWQGHRNTNCTTICVIQYNRKAVFHNFYLWNIIYKRFFCRSDEQMIPCTIFLAGDYFPSCWHPCGLTVEPTNVFCHNFETDVSTVHSSMVPLSFQHTEKRLFRILRSKMNIFHL